MSRSTPPRPRSASPSTPASPAPAQIEVVNPGSPAPVLYGGFTYLEPFRVDRITPAPGITILRAAIIPPKDLTLNKVLARVAVAP